MALQFNRRVLTDRLLSGLTLRLFTNDVRPDVDTEASGLQELPGHYAAWSGKPITFTFMAGIGDVYGYFLTDQSGQCVASERFPDGPYTVQRMGDEITVDCSIAVKV